jgi:hypothetical protein
MLPKKYVLDSGPSVFYAMYICHCLTFTIKQDTYIITGKTNIWQEKSKQGVVFSHHMHLRMVFKKVCGRFAMR